jgi:hypothetical protein
MQLKKQCIRINSLIKKFYGVIINLIYAVIPNSFSFDSGTQNYFLIVGGLIVLAGISYGGYCLYSSKNEELKFYQKSEVEESEVNSKLDMNEFIKLKDDSIILAKVEEYEKLEKEGVKLIEKELKSLIEVEFSSSSKKNYIQILIKKLEGLIDEKKNLISDYTKLVGTKEEIMIKKLKGVINDRNEILFNYKNLVNERDEVVLDYNALVDERKELIQCNLELIDENQELVTENALVKAEIVRSVGIIRKLGLHHDNLISKHEKYIEFAKNVKCFSNSEQ